MEKCPVCMAVLKRMPLCHRCRSDLSLPADIEQQSNHLLAEAKERCLSGKYGEMLQKVEQAASLKETYDARKMIAFAALLNGDFKKALGLFMAEGKHL